MSVSIIIPAYNEEEFIKNTLDTLFKYLSGECVFEVIVVNNASTDETGKILKEYPSVKNVYVENKVTVSKARNIGFSYAKYDTVVFIDADILITNSWVSALKKYDETNNCFVTGTKVGVSIDPSWIENNWFLAMKRKSIANYINSGNLIVKRKIVEDLNGFDGLLITGEDVDFSIRAKLKGYEIIDNSEFFVHHEGFPRSLGAFYRREMWHGIGDMKSMQAYLSSKIALFSTVVVLLLLCVLGSVLSGNMILGIILLLIWLMLHILFIAYRFKIKGFQHLVMLFLLNNAYSFARLAAVTRKNNI